MIKFVSAITILILSFNAHAATTAVTVGQQQAPTVTSTQVEDDQIVSNIKLRLTSSQNLIGTKITVSSEGGVVTLTGDVATQAQADAAILEAQSVPGVQDVKSNFNILHGVTVNTVGPAVPNPQPQTNTVIITK